MEETAAQIHGKELIRVQFQNQNRNLVILDRRDSTGVFDAHEKVEEFNNLNGTSLRVIPHDVADFALNTGETWKNLSDCFGFPVDASIAYENPGTKMGAEIVHPAPGEPKVTMATGKYEGEKDIALVALGLSAKDIKKEDNSIILDISDERLIPVPNFPPTSGWYIQHKPTGVPHGDDVGEKPESRYLNHWGGAYVGLIKRDVDADGCNYRQYVDVNSKFSWKHALVAEVPEPDVAKIKELIDSAKE